MIILASDTSTGSISVAISSEKELLYSETIREGSVHSTDHMPLIEKALSLTGFTYSEIDLFACTTGPGSYTGIRINVSTMKALAYASGKGVAGISTLKTLEYPFRSETTLVCPVIDARNRRVFSSVLLDGKSITDEGNYSYDEICEHLLSSLYITAEREKISGLPLKVVFCGNAAPKIENDEVFCEVRKKISKIDPHVIFEFADCVPQAEDVAALAREMSNDVISFDPFRLSAEYISPSQAERMRSLSYDTTIIRKADENDLDRITEIENESFTVPWSRESISTDISNNRNAVYIVAEIDGDIIGYAGCHIVYEQAQITTLAISDSMRRRGAGRSLVRYICDHCRNAGCTQLFLEVRASNRSALSLYISEGFKVIDLRKAYYEDNDESAIIMLKDL